MKSIILCCLLILTYFLIQITQDINITSLILSKNIIIQDDQIIIQQQSQQTLSQIQEQTLDKLQEQIKQHQQQNEELYSSTKTTQTTTICNEIILKEYDGIIRSGYLNVGINNSTSSLSFIFYGAKSIPINQLSSKPILIWLNGGPGCSSQFGNFFEIGPLHLNLNQNNYYKQNSMNNKNNNKNKFYFTNNEYSWTNEYNVLFIDQPIGTGISYAEKYEDIPTNQQQIAEQFYFALQQLYNSPNGCFNQLNFYQQSSQRNNQENQSSYPPLYIFGESYAGKYIPSISEKIYKEGNIFNLKGIGLGDAFTNPEIILKSIPDYAMQNNLINTAQEYEDSWQAAQDVLDAMHDEQREQDTRLLFWRFLSITNPKNVDFYNIKRMNGEVQDGNILENYLNEEIEGIRQVFKLTRMESNFQKIYTRCDRRVQRAMSSDFMRNDCPKKVEYLLNEGLEITIFNGDLDMLVPYTAPMEWVKNLFNWKDVNNFIDSELIDWQIDNLIVGKQKKYKNLQFYIVYDSGHMVPQDQPLLSLIILHSAIHSKEYYEYYHQEYIFQQQQKYQSHFNQNQFHQFKN